MTDGEEQRARLAPDERDRRFIRRIAILALAIIIPLSCGAFVSESRRSTVSGLKRALSFPTPVT